ncbi:EI24 domain-containing protein [Sphingomonas sp. IW22]|uniref:EI24 domain-containing protein n=1 Tax=Sphingomonas sp. IW22 TaxID=3242489 RepID=UPI0035216248
MLRAFALSLRQLGDPPVLRVLAKSLALTLAIFAALVVGGWWLARWAAQSLGAGWWSELAGFAAVVASVLAAWLLFRAVAIAVVGLFADDVVAAVERRHYTDALNNARPVPLMRGVAMGLGSAGRAVAVNLLLSPIYLALLVTGVGTAALFFAVNGWLLGRDLGDMVAARHRSGAAMREFRATTRGGRWMLGLAGTALLVVPGVNLVAPVLAAAMATHWYHRRGRM